MNLMSVNHLNNELFFAEGPARSRTITIEDRYWDFARSIGGGNISRGIRMALYAAATKNGTETAETSKETTDIHSTTSRT